MKSKKKQNKLTNPKIFIPMSVLVFLAGFSVITASVLHSYSLVGKTCADGTNTCEQIRTKQEVDERLEKTELGVKVGMSLMVLSAVILIVPSTVLIVKDSR